MTDVTSSTDDPAGLDVTLFKCEARIDGDVVIDIESQIADRAYLQVPVLEPSPRLVPLREGLTGVIAPQWVLLMATCRGLGEFGEVQHRVSVHGLSDGPDRRLQLLTLATSVASVVGDDNDCTSSAPGNLAAAVPPVPVPVPLQPKACGLVDRIQLLGFLAAVPASGWTEVRTPLPAPLVETCELSWTDVGSVADRPSLQVTIVRGVFSDALSPARFGPNELVRLDHECNGQPTTYVVAEEDASGTDVLPGSPYDVLGLFAAAAAERDGCPLS